MLSAPRQCPDAVRAPAPSRPRVAAVRMPHAAEMSPLPRERGWAKEQPQGPLLLSSWTFQDKSLTCKGSPATNSKTDDNCCSRGQTGQYALMPALWPESLAAPDPACNLHQFISSSLDLKSLNQENNTLLLQPCAGSVSDHTPAHQVRSSGQGL